jgi:hypothetical protein
VIGCGYGRMEKNLIAEEYLKFIERSVASCFKGEEKKKENMKEKGRTV